MANAPWRSPRQRHNLGQAIAEELANTPVSKTAAFTAADEQRKRTTEVNSSAAVTGSIPGNVFKAGEKLRFVQTGTGLFTLAGINGLTLNTPTTLKSGGRYSTLVVEFSSPTVAFVSGNLATA